MRVPATDRAIWRPTSVDPVNATLSTAGVLDQRPSGVAGPGDDVHDARWQVGLLADVRERQGGQGRRLGRLEHHRVAARQGGGDLPGQHQQGEVPRDDLGGDPKGPGVGTEPGVVELVGPARVVEEVGGHQRDVDVAALADGLAVVDGLEHRQLAGPLLHEAGEPIQVLAAVAAAQSGPGTVVGGAGGIDRTVDVLRAGGHDLGQHLFRGRVDGLEAGPVDGVDHLAADEQAVRRLDVDDRAGFRGGGVVEGWHLRGPVSRG